MGAKYITEGTFTVDPVTIHPRTNDPRKSEIIVLLDVTKNPDAQEALSRRYSNDRITILRLRSGNLAAALLCAGAAAQLVDPDLARAQMMCSAHVTGMCASNPPFPCSYSPGWEDSCRAIDRRLNPLIQQMFDEEKRREQEASDLDFVRGVAGQESGK